jgi:anti-anti-sigma factor
MMDVVPGWSLDVDRGPDWIFVRLHDNSSEYGAEGMAECLWELLEQQFAHRIVLELDDVQHLSSPLIGELVRLSKRVYSHDGMLRICGLSPENFQILRLMRLDGCFPNYDNRTEAVMGQCPKQPR